MQTEVEIDIADGTYVCAIGLQGIREIQIAGGGDGIGAIIARILAGRMATAKTTDGEPRQTIGITIEAAYRIDEIIAFVKQGLIGGGRGVVNKLPVTVDQRRANELINNYLLPPVGNLDTLWTHAAFLALNLAEGYEPPKKKEASPEKAAPQRSRRKTHTSPA